MTQYENFTVTEINFLESEGVDLSTLGTQTVTIIPNEGYVINANDFALAVPYPPEVDPASFQFTQNADRIDVTFLFAAGAIMPANAIEVPLCFTGFAIETEYTIDGTVDIITTYATPVSQTATYSNSGSFNSQENVYNVTIAADANYYFYVEPIVALITGNTLNYNITSTKQYNGPNGELTAVSFTVQYTYPNQNVSGDLIRIAADAIPVVNITPLVSGFTFDGIFGYSQPNVPSVGDSRELILTGDPGAVFSVSFFENAGSGTETVYATNIPMPSSGTYIIPNIAFPSYAAGTPPYQVRITGDINPLIAIPGPDIHVDFNQSQQLNLTVSGSTSNSDLTLSGTPDAFNLLSNNTYIPSATFDFDFKATSTIPILVQNPVTASSFNPAIPDPNLTDPNGNYVYSLTSIDTVLKEPGHVLTATLASGGDEYIDGAYTGVSTTTPGNGTGLTFDITVSGGAVTTISIANGGVDYSVGDPISIGTTSGVAATADILDVLPGYEYSVDGTITMSSSGSTSAAHDLNLDNHIITVALPTIVTSSVTNISGSTATSGGESITDGGGTISSKGIQWSELADFSTILGANDEGTGTANFSSIITGLVSGNTYYVRAYAQNEAGVAYGQVESFQSSAAPTLSTVAISAISWDSATSGGENISDNGSSIVSKGVQWSTSSSFATIEGSTNDGSGTSNFVSNLTGLSETTTYYVRAYATNAVGTGYGQTETFQTIALPVTGLSWTTTVDNTCNPTPWTISNNNSTIRYDIEDSNNCGGSCTVTQAGTATATITVGASDVDMDLDFEGIGELEAASFEKISFDLNGTEVARANAAGGGLGCQMGPVVKTFITAPPYRLNANTTHTLFIDFTTNDGQYHQGAYYEVDLSFTNVP